MSEKKSTWIFVCGLDEYSSNLNSLFLSKILEYLKTGKVIEHSNANEFKALKEKHKEYSGFKVFRTQVLTEDIKNEIVIDGAIAFFTYSDVRNVISSKVIGGKLERTIENIGEAALRYLEEYNSWLSMGNYLIERKFENYLLDIKEECKFITSTLNSKLSFFDVRKIINELSSSIEIERRENIFPDSEFYKTFLNSNEIVEIESKADAWLVNHGYELMWPETSSFISHSQQYEDFLAWCLLDKKVTGLVIEVGSFDGIHISNSYSFDLLKAQTLCIEPNPFFYKFLAENRPNAITVNQAVVGDESIKQIDFYAEDTGVLSGCIIDEQDIKDRYKNRGLEFKQPEKISVKASTLNQILISNNLQNKKIDIVSIDVEGLEINVLQGFDINKYKPKLFIIEANSQDDSDKIVKYFEGFPDYYLILKNNNNLFIIHNSLLPYSLYFDYDIARQAYQFHPRGPKFAIQPFKPYVKFSCLPVEKATVFPKGVFLKEQ